MLQEAVAFGAIGLKFFIYIEIKSGLLALLLLQCLYSMRLPRRIKLNLVRDLDARVKVLEALYSFGACYILALTNGFRIPCVM